MSILLYTGPSIGGIINNNNNNNNNKHHSPRRSNNWCGSVSRGFATLPPHEIVGLPSLSPVREGIIFLSLLEVKGLKQTTFEQHFV
jgi:hypothetical protein